MAIMISLSFSRKLIMTVMCVLVSSNFSHGQDLFSPDQLKEDLLFYKDKLKAHHPNLYLYSSEGVVEHYFDSLCQRIDHPLTQEEFYRLIASTASLIKDGHTLILPAATSVADHNAHSRFIPLQLGLNKGRLYVKRDCSGRLLLNEGEVVSEINGVSAGDIVAALLNCQVRDGHNTAYAEWIIDKYFRDFYSYSFGHPDTFKISLSGDSSVREVTLPALSKDSIVYYRKRIDLKFDSLHSPLLCAFPETDPRWSTALLTIADFHDDYLEKEFNLNFKVSIKVMMDSIIDLGTRNLIIDLRDNQGGDIENGVFLLSFLTGKPFKIVNGYYRIRHGKLQSCKGPSMGVQLPVRKPFKGQIFVLLNGGSFSNSVIVSSSLKRNTNALFAGTVSGGNPNVLAGYARTYELPHTKMLVDVPTLQFVMTSLEENSGMGLQPDYVLPPAIADGINAQDKVLEFVLSYIRNNK